MNILLLAFEIESVLMRELSKLYKEDKSNTTHILNCDIWTFVNNKNFYNKIYTKGCSDYFSNFEEEYKLLNTFDSDIEVDFDFLRKCEEEYNLKISAIVKTDGQLDTSSHNRDYYQLAPSKIKLKWIELVIKKCLKLLDEFNPNVIITVNNNYFIKNILYYIATSKNIPFVNTMNARVKDKFIATDNMSINTSRYFIENMNGIGDDCKVEAEDFIESIQSKNIASYDSHENLIRTYKSNSLSKDFKKVLRNIFWITYNELFLKTHYKGIFKPNYFDSMYFKAIWNNIRNQVFRKHLFLNKIKFEKELLDNLKFYYFALHVIPESTILTQADDNKEVSIIKDISAKLPADCFLVVKENIEMWGERPASFYKELSQIHNVIMMKPLYNSIALIKKSLGVISMAGTVTFEACIIGKRAIVVGNPEYSILTPVEKYNKYTTTFSGDDSLIINNNILQYIQTVLKYGESVDMNYLLYGENERVETERFKKDLSKLKNMFAKLIEHKNKARKLNFNVALTKGALHEGIYK